MSNYRPGTLDDSDALKRRLGEIDRTAREANKPTGIERLRNNGENAVH